MFSAHQIQRWMLIVGLAVAMAIILYPIFHREFRLNADGSSPDDFVCKRCGGIMALKVETGVATCFRCETDTVIKPPRGAELGRFPRSAD